MSRNNKIIASIVVFSILITIAELIYIFYSPTKSKPASTPTGSQKPKCFLLKTSCSKAEKIYFKGKFYGLGFKSKDDSLVSVLNGLATTGTLNIETSSGLKKYFIIQLETKGNNKNNYKIIYILSYFPDFNPQKVSDGQVLTKLGPYGMPPFGDFNLVVASYDENNNMFDPMIILKSL